MVRTPSVDEAPDGLYILNLHLAPIRYTDAVPSRPMLYRVFRADGTRSAYNANSEIEDFQEGDCDC